MPLALQQDWHCLYRLSISLAGRVSCNALLINATAGQSTGSLAHMKACQVLLRCKSSMQEHIFKCKIHKTLKSVLCADLDCVLKGSIVYVGLARCTI